MFSNYSVKKILPRLVIMAVAINLSFYICAAVVDIANIIGANVFTIFQNLATQTGGSYSLNFGESVLFSIGLLIIVIVAGLPCLLGFFMILIMLMFREVAITVLIIISPIAFLLYLLPNTEKLFKKWWTEFWRMLFVYPMMAAVWGGCMFVSALLGSMAYQEDGGHPLLTIMKVGLRIVPAFAIIPIMKMGGQIMGKINSAVNTAAQKSGMKDMAKNMQTWGRRGGLTTAANRMIKGSYSRFRKGDGTIDMDRVRDAANNGDKTAQKLKAWEKDPTKKRIFESNKPNPASYAAGGLLHLAASGPFIGKIAEARAKEAEKHTAGAIAAEKAGMDAAQNANALKHAIEKQEYELKLKADDRAVETAARMKVNEIESQSGVNSTSFKVATRAMGMAPNSPGVAAFRAQEQAKLTNEMTSQFEENAQMFDSTGKETRGPLNAKSIVMQMEEGNAIGFGANGGKLKLDGTGKFISEGGKSPDEQQAAISSVLNVLHGSVGSESDINALQALSSQVEAMGTTDGLSGANKTQIEKMKRDIENQKSIIEARSKGIPTPGGPTPSAPAPGAPTSGT